MKIIFYAPKIKKGKKLFLVVSVEETFNNYSIIMNRRKPLSG